MKVKIYVDWEEQAIYTEANAKQHLAEVKADEDNFADYASDWLEDEIEDFLRVKNIPRTFSNVFNLSETYRNEIMKNLRKSYEERVEANFEKDYEEITIEV